MTEIMKLVEKVKFITIKGFKGSLGARHSTKNVPSLPGSVQFSLFIYFRIWKYNEIDLNKNKKNTHNNRFYNLISRINSI